MRNFKKIVTVAELKKLIQGRKIALAHGVFDVFHIGHLKHLEVAKQNADIDQMHTSSSALADLSCCVHAHQLQDWR